MIQKVQMIFLRVAYKYLRIHSGYKVKHFNAGRFVFVRRGEYQFLVGDKS